MHQRKNGLTFQQVARAVAELADRRELFILAAIGWGLVPITRSAYDAYVNVTGRCTNVVGDGSEEAVVDDKTEKSNSNRIRAAYERITPWDDEKFDARFHELHERMVLWEGEKLNHRMHDGLSEAMRASETSKMGKAPFQETILYQVVDHVSQASKIGLSVILIDCITFVTRMMGYSTNIMKSVPRIYSKVAYTGWITHRLQILKRWFLEKKLVKSYGTPFVW